MSQGNKELRLNSDIEQLKTNAEICKRKHLFLVAAIWTLIPLFLFMFSLFIIFVV